MTLDEKKAWAAEQLRRKAAALGRLPKKEDFDPVLISRIKAYLGPWPRALEAAGLKEKRQKASTPHPHKCAGDRPKKRSEEP